MKFYKMQGAGNDFIIIDNMKLKIPVEKLSQIAKKLCQRRVSIGADGFMVIDDRTVDFKDKTSNTIAVNPISSIGQKTHLFLTSNYIFGCKHTIKKIR